MMCHTLSLPVAAKTPAVTRSESPGRKKPTRSPVSAKTIAVIAVSPPTRIRVSTSVSLWKRSFSQSIGSGDRVTRFDDGRDPAPRREAARDGHPSGAARGHAVPQDAVDRVLVEDAD